MTINNPAYYSYRPTKLKVSRLGVNISKEMNDTLNMKSSEYMIVGEHYLNHGGATSNTYSLIVDEEGIAVNCSLDDRWSNSNNYGLQLRGNTFIDGNLIVTGIISAPGTSNSSGGSSNFWRYAEATNIYYDGNVTIGNYNDSRNNTYSLNISEPANYNINKAQVGIENRQNSELRMAILGASCNSPVVFNTPGKIPIEFHVGRKQSYFDQVYTKSYSNYGEFLTVKTDTPNYQNIFEAPHLNIDPNGNVGVRTSLNYPITYQLRKKHPVIPNTIIYPVVRDPMSLHVDGSFYACNILIYDYEFDTPRNIDEIYIRKQGETIFACNIIPGSFARGNFIFRSNVAILGEIDENYVLSVYGQEVVHSNLIVKENLGVSKNIVADRIFTHDSGSFSNNILVQNNIYFKANLYKQRVNIETGSNEWGLIQFDDRFFEKPSLSNIYYIGDGIATVGRMGVGVNPTLDEVNQQFVVRKRDPSIFELELMDKTLSTYDKTLYIGHPTVDPELRSDGSVVFLTPGPNDDNYNRFFTYAPQNMYFYAGFDKRISQFRIEACNVPTFGIYVNKRVGVKTFNPTHDLDVNGDIAVSGSFYQKIPGETNAVKMAMWRDMDYSYIINGNPAVYKGIEYYNVSAPHVGVNTIAQSGYGMTVGGRLLSIDGYYTSDGYRIVPLYDSFEMFGKPTPDYEHMYTNGRVGIGVLFPQTTLDLRDANTSTGIRLVQSPNTVSTYIQMSGENNNFMFHMNDAQNIFELYQGASNQLYNNSNIKPFMVYKKTNNTYQMVINSNINMVNANPSDTLLVNGNVNVQGDITITGTYRVRGAPIIITGQQATYVNETSPENVYIAGENMYINTNSDNYGAIFVGYGTDIPAESRPTSDPFYKSTMYIRQNNSTSLYNIKFDSKSDYSLTEYKNKNGSKGVIGVTIDNAMFIGRDISTPYLTVKDIGSGRNVIGIGTITTDSSKIQVYTNVTNQSIAKFTHASLNPDVDNFVSDIILQKITSGTEKTQWTIQGPNRAYQQKMQFIYSDNTTAASEKFTFTKDGCLGIGHTTPEFAIDIAEIGDRGSIRMLQTNPFVAKPQLLFQSGLGQYGADFATDYRMYSFSNNFYLDMQDVIVGRKVLFHFTSNNSMGIHQEADSRYSVSIGGDLNVRDAIYLNGRPFFSVGDALNDLGTYISGYNLFINPDQTVYGGVHINGNTVSSNIFQINSGNNGNTSVFDSIYTQSQIHFRNKLPGNIRRIWRLASSNDSFIMEYRSNVPYDESYISDTSPNYSRATEWVQTATEGLYTQRLNGSLVLSKPNQEISFNDTSFIESKDTNLYITTNYLGIGTSSPANKVDIYNNTPGVSVRINHTSPFTNILEVVTPDTQLQHVFDPFGNVGIGTYLPRAKLDVVGQIQTYSGSYNKPSYSFSSACNTGMYLGSNNSILFTTNGVNRVVFTSNGYVGINNSIPRGKLDILANNQNESALVITQYGNSNLLEGYSEDRVSIVVNNKGNLGIGTYAPIYPLHVIGDTGLYGNIHPLSNNAFSLGTTTHRWKDIFLTGASVYLDNIALKTYTDDKLQVVKDNSLAPIVTNSIYLDRIDNDTVILTKDVTNPLNLPMILTSNTASYSSNAYTPIVLNQTTHTVGIGTYVTSGFVHIHNNSNIAPLFVTQKGQGDALVIEGDGFINQDLSKFKISVTNDGSLSFGKSSGVARVMIEEDNFKAGLYINQKSEYYKSLQIAYNGDIKTTVDGLGRVGIGTQNPQTPLHVQDGTTKLVYENTNDYALDVRGLSYFSSNIYAYGNVEIFNDLITHGNTIQDSDRNIKYNIEPIESALEKIRKLSGYTFNKYNSARRETGVIAQEVQDVLPEAVFKKDDGVLGVAYGNMIGLLIEGIKELSLQVEDLKKRLG